MENISFIESLQGRFDGYIRLPDVRKLAEQVATIDGWYLVEPGAPLPEITVTGAAANLHLVGLIDEILLEERGIWSTMVYAQTMDDPCLIKVFHPRRAGCGCVPS